MELLRRAVEHHAAIHADRDGLVRSAVEGLSMMRATAPNGITHAIYKPVVCVVLQGTKQVSMGGAVHSFEAGRSVIVPVDAPVVGRIVEASAARPYLALAVELDMGVMRDLMGEVVSAVEPPDGRTGLSVEDTTEAVADCAFRLVRLLDRPEAVPVLRGSIVRELHYWLLAGPHGGSLRRLAPLDSHAQRVGRAIAMLRADIAQAVSIERLADAAGMSASSFHQHFKSVTSLSPRQFHKQLRLLEARRLMAAEGLSASRAAFAVGYESVSQFTREYGRMFGASPRRDVVEARAAA